METDAGHEYCFSAAKVENSDAACSFIIVMPHRFEDSDMFEGGGLSALN